MNRKSLRLAFSLVVTSLLAGSLTIGCGGGSKGYPEASVDFDAHPDVKITADAKADSVDAGSNAPVIGTGSTLIVKGSIELIGSGSDTCTNAVPPGGDRWCGFSQLSTSLVDSELWVVNVTKVAAGVTVQCLPTVADPNCIRLSTGLYVDQTSGVSVHGFDGDTLTFSETPSNSSTFFLGHIFAWRPGWTAPHDLTGNNGIVCNGNPSTNAVVCLENPVADSSGNIRTAELHAGFVDDSGTQPPLVDTLLITGTGDAAGVRKWGGRLTPDGKSIAWSTRATDQGTEDLKWQNVGDDTSRISVATDVDQWTVSADSKKWFWLKTFNYDVSGSPSGTLQSAPYPAGGATPLTIATAVGDYTTAASGVYYRKGVTADFGTLLLAADRDMPSAVTMVDTGVAFVFDASKDGKNATYTKNIQSVGTNLFLFDAYISGAAATMPCALTTMATAFVPPVFLSGGTLSVWGRFNQITGEIEGVSTTIPGCVTKKFASDLYGVSAAGDDGVVYLDTLDPGQTVNEATLRYGQVKQGALPAPGNVVQLRAGLEYATLVPALPAVIYTITTNTSADGLYLNATLPFVVTPPSTTDAGTADTGVMDTGVGSSDASDAGVSDAQPNG